MPLLMVKDFNAKGFSVSKEYMTNADTPYLAMKGIISNPVNPYSGNPISDQGKKDGIIIFNSMIWDIRKNNGNTFKPGDWYSLKDSIWKKENWKFIGTH